MPGMTIRVLAITCVLLASGCSDDGKAVIHVDASLPAVPTGESGLRALSTYEDIERSLAIAPGRGVVIDIESRDIGVPLVVDTGSVERLMVYSAEPMATILSSRSAGRAYLVSRSSSNGLGSYCLHLKERVSIVGRDNLRDPSVDLVLRFDEGYSPVGFQGVCPAITIRFNGLANVVGRVAPGRARNIGLTIR